MSRRRMMYDRGDNLETIEVRRNEFYFNLWLNADKTCNFVSAGTVTAFYVDDVLSGSTNFSANSVPCIKGTHDYRCTITGPTNVQCFTPGASGAFVTVRVPNVNFGTFGIINPLNAGTTIEILRTVPPLVQSNYFNVSKIKVIKVPKGCLEAYKTASVWSNAADKIVEVNYKYID